MTDVKGDTSKEAIERLLAVVSDRSRRVDAVWAVQTADGVYSVCSASLAAVATEQRFRVRLVGACDGS